MNWDQVKGNWTQLKCSVKVQWGRHTGGDLCEVEGLREKLIGNVNDAYGMSKVKVERQVNAFA